ncbi:hypothetical protein, partial [Enterobacter cloacae complex sp. 2DZ2F20B]|uniref:hypothetical protein n=1 Tax=Enterobacter cloacae complex sp. 2DZ2F20B TaxID=2511993 RepID=UPI001CA541D0
ESRTFDSVLVVYVDYTLLSSNCHTLDVRSIFASFGVVFPQSACYLIMRIVGFKTTFSGHSFSKPNIGSLYLSKSDQMH